MSFTIAQQCYAQWMQSHGLENRNVTSVVLSGENLIAGVEGGYLYLSIDAGETWTPLDTIVGMKGSSFGSAIVIPTLVSLFDNGASLFAGIWNAYPGGVYVSTDHGISWNVADSSFIESVNSFTSIGGTIFAGTNHGVFLSIDQGKIWTAGNTGISNYQVWSIAHLGIYLYAGTTGEGIFRSNDNGATWQAADSGMTWTATYDSLSFLTISSVAALGNHLFAGPNTGGCYASSDSGFSWRADTGFTQDPIVTLFAKDPALFAASNRSIYFSTDKGISWEDISDGISLGLIFAFAISDSNLVAATGNGIWLYPLSQLTILKSDQSATPAEYILKQNYPNPFNPTTTISYELPVNGFVNLEIYDVLGRRIVALINERQSAGTHSVKFNGADLPSGVYLYRLSTANFLDTKKLMLIK